ncbi:unnamed protein product [Dicrocoelium dendriticum]|nr:unnamed protein product [Dicrocoelium dendriticum]
MYTMKSMPEAEGLTHKIPGNSLPDGEPGIRNTEARIIRKRTFRSRTRVLYVVIIILTVFLMLAIGLAIFYGVSFHCQDSTTSENVTDTLDQLLEEAIKKRTTKSVRLPLTLLPKFYDLRLQVHLHEGDPVDFYFNGSVLVKAFCRQSTHVFFVHSHSTLNVSLNQIQVQKLSDSDTLAEIVKIKNVSYDDDLQWYEFLLTEELKAGHFYQITFGQFWSPLRRELKGWYLSSYTEDRVEKYLATSQLQPTDARRVFPCWDEPGFKAQFQITLIRHEEYHSLSNMGIRRTETLPGGWYADVFHPTMNTSTYLLAFVVSQFRSLSTTDGKGRNFTVWARPQAVKHARYALDIGRKIIRYFEDYFEVPYPLEKTDMIAVPDFSAGAMENWGLMIYREATMLWDPTVGTAANQQKVATVVSHEIAHQWFGNLVTLNWWDDLWLNEGFATFVETSGVNHVHPDWGMDEQFLLEDIQKVLISDASPGSRPVIQSVKFPNEINDIFDVISYHKGASVLRMMESFMGRDTFRKGVKKYLSDHKFKNTVHEDLWNSLTEATQNTGKALDIKAIMETWLMQMNYPLVTVRRVSGQIFQFNQSHYLDPADAKPPKNPTAFKFQWQIPLTFGDSVNVNWTDNEVIWLKNESMTIPVNIEPSSWYIFNIRQAGFYRVHYADDNWQRITQQLIDDPTVIPVHTRTQCLDDLFNLANRGTVPYSLFLNLTKYLYREDKYVPWETARRAFETMSRMLALDPALWLMQAYLRTLVDSTLQQVDWDSVQENENHMKHMLRGTIIKLACQVEHGLCVRKVKEMYRKWMATNATNTIPPSLRSIVYCSAIHWGGQLEWHFLHSRLLDDAKDEEPGNIRAALACTRDVVIMKDYLNSLLRLEHQDPTDLVEPITQIAQNPIGHILLWDFVREAWRRMTSDADRDKKINPIDSAVLVMLRILSKPVGTLNNVPPPEEVSELERRTQTKVEKHVLQRGFKEVFRRAERNQKWSKAHRNEIHQWLKQNVKDVNVLL